MKKYLVGTLLASMLVVVPFISLAANIPPTPIDVIKKSATITQVYEGGTQKLKSTFKLSIGNRVSGGPNIYIPQSYIPISSDFINTTIEAGRSSEGGKCDFVYFSTTNVPVVYDANNINAYLTLAGGQTIDYTLIKTCEVGKMHPGTYIARLSYLIWTDSLSSDLKIMTKDLISSNIVTDNYQYIVGEKGPWISGAIYDSSAQEVSLIGQRLGAGLKNIYLNGSIVPKVDITYFPAADDKSARFRVKTPGSYIVYIDSSYGKSNTVSLTVPQHPVIVSVNNKCASSIDATAECILVNGYGLQNASVYLNGSIANAKNISLLDDGKKIIFETKLPEGTYPLYVVAGGRKSNIVEAIVKYQPPIKFSITSVNGSSIIPSIIPYNSKFTVNWSSPVGSECSTFGPGNIPTSDGGYWALSSDDFGNIPSTGTKTLFARSDLVGYKNPIKLRVQCYTADGSSDNSAELSIAVSAPVAPTISTTGSTLRAYPGGWIKFRGTNLATNISIKDLQYPVIGAKLSDGNKRLDFQIDPREQPRVVKASVVGPTGEHSNIVDITVVARPTTTATTTSMSSSKMGQLANILSVLSVILGQMKDE